MAETLPKDILENIFSRLPIESTLQCERVCKTWRRIVGKSVGIVFTFKKTIPSSTKDLVTQLYYGDPRCETRIEKYYFENTLTPLVPALADPYGMVGSCNGLVCFKAEDPNYSKDGRAFGLAFICNNPITGEAVYIPGLGNREVSLHPPIGEFGYVGSTNEYKVVRIYFKASCVQVFTLGSHLGWRYKEERVPRYWFFSSQESGI
ncbi:uncharacterized protein LOC113330066 [Papaver somniferum]|uniref:uncharacterized protein LOC113330066 n=1 Tax=Papaver somniferum TaxID=3469 RepID=UPI000E6F9258|nr:uncharacterized protein LOC113330066 [Papaver somniferum]